MNLVKFRFDMFLLNFYKDKLNKIIIEKTKNKKKNKKVTNENNKVFDKICRICYDDTESKKNPLIYPCNCCGTTKWIHKECLLKWIETSDNLNCPQCKYKYVIKKKRKYPLLDKIINYNSLILLGIFFLLIYTSTITINSFLYYLNIRPYSFIFKFDIYFLSRFFKIFHFITMVTLFILTSRGQMTVNDYIYGFQFGNQFSIFILCFTKIKKIFKNYIEKKKESKIFIENKV